MQYKALICDVDGTLISEEFAFPSKKVTQAINAVSKLIHTGIATSRSYATSLHIIEHLNLTGPSILDGGAQIIDLKTNKVLVEHTISSKDFHKICSVFDLFHLPLDIQETKGRFFRYETGYQPKKVTQMLCQSINNKLADEVIRKLSEISTIAAYKITAYEKGKVWVTAANAQSTKQHGVLEVARILGIETHEIIGVGDGYTPHK